MNREEREFEARVKDIFKRFLTSVTKLEELVAIAGKFLDGFQQALDFLRRPPINTGSDLIRKIIEDNETKRVKSYIGAGCTNVHDRTENMGKLNTSLLGLHDHINKAKSIINELQHLLEDLTAEIQTANGRLSPLSEALSNQLNQLDMNEENVSSSSEADIQDFDVISYAALMGMIYGMVKQDYEMQERIVSSLSLKSKAEVLGSYCLMWSLRPFVNDEIMHQAWTLIP